MRPFGKKMDLACKPQIRDFKALSLNAHGVHLKHHTVTINYLKHLTLTIEIHLRL